VWISSGHPVGRWAVRAVGRRPAGATPHRDRSSKQQSSPTRTGVISPVPLLDEQERPAAAAYLLPGTSYRKTPQHKGAAWDDGGTRPSRPRPLTIWKTHAGGCGRCSALLMRPHSAQALQQTHTPARPPPKPCDRISMRPTGCSKRGKGGGAQAPHGSRAVDMYWVLPPLPLSKTALVKHTKAGQPGTPHAHHSHSRPAPPACLAPGAQQAGQAGSCLYVHTHVRAARALGVLPGLACVAGEPSQQSPGVCAPAARNARPRIE